MAEAGFISRVYFPGVKRGDKTGGIYEYTFSQGEWNWVFVPFPDSSSPCDLNLGKLKTGAVKKTDRLAIGELRNDDTGRVYCITWSDSCLVEINMEASGIEEKGGIKYNPMFFIFPNPFFRGVRISVYTPCSAELLIYNVLGQLIKKFKISQKGKYTLYWDGRDRYGKITGSGVYLCVLKTSKSTVVKKLINLQRKGVK